MDTMWRMNWGKLAPGGLVGKLLSDAEERFVAGGI